MESTNPKILVVDDVTENRELLRETVEPEGFDAYCVPNGDLAIEVASQTPMDLILLDIRMPGNLNGIDTCKVLKQVPETAPVPVIFITVDKEPETLVQAFEAGGVDYVNKPFSKDELMARIRTHVELYRLRRELESKNRDLEEEIQRRETAEIERDLLSEQTADQGGGSGLIGQSEQALALQERIDSLLAYEKVTVLLCGESGTGKELVAKAIHHGRVKGKAPFISLNCAAIPGELAESMLFGHLKGSFSGAVRDQKGYFEMAGNGTLFLDEIGELPLPMQAKLLRVLEERVVVPVGSTASRKVDAGIIAATNKDLQVAVRDGVFRKDLYFRLAQFVCQIPPLRERKEDILLLAHHFMLLFASQMGRPAPVVTEGTKQVLLSYGYPGNIRELKNIMERAVIESGGASIQPEHLHFFSYGQQVDSVAASEADPVVEAVAGGKWPDHLSRVEKAILDYIDEHGSIRNAECRNELKINIDQAYYLLNQLEKAGLIRKIGQSRGTRYILENA
jgi:DNA-binding NtrC family response regulator